MLKQKKTVGEKCLREENCKGEMFKRRKQQGRNVKEKKTVREKCLTEENCKGKMFNRRKQQERNV